jgi:methionyl-tRNA formyltransferase
MNLSNMKMRLVFIGSTQFGLRCLEGIIHLPEIEVVGIVTNPKVFSISFCPSGLNNVRHADFSPIAEEHGIPIWNMVGKMTDPSLIDKINEWKPDFILVAGWYHLIPKKILNIAPTAGLHASLLPDYSGCAPLVWAIINGEEKTGITLFLMDEGVDSGPIIGQKEEPIYFEDTIATLYARIEETGLRLLREQLPKIARGEASYTIQDESRRRLVSPRSPEDGEIDWNWPARRIYNFIRAQTKPYPGAFTFYNNKKLTIWKSRLPLSHETKPCDAPKAGTVFLDQHGSSELVVYCKDRTPLLLLELEFEGEEMSGTEFAKRFLTGRETKLGRCD